MLHRGVKSLLDNYGFFYVWNNPSTVDLNSFHLMFKQRLLDTFKQQWFNYLSNSSPLCLYKHFKTSFGYEPYLNILPQKERYYFSRFRLSAHNLHIVTGRYTKNRVDRSLRVCLVCKNGDIEDEYHFVLKCSAYSDIRKNYINPFYYNNPNVHKFILLMKCSDEHTIKYLSKYVYESLILRNTLI